MQILTPWGLIFYFRASPTQAAWFTAKQEAAEFFGRLKAIEKRLNDLKSTTSRLAGRIPKFLSPRRTVSFRI